MTRHPRHLSNSKWKGRERKGKGIIQKLKLLALTRRPILRFPNASILFEEGKCLARGLVASLESF